MVQKLNSHLDVGRLTGDDDQPLVFTASGSRSTIHTYAHSTGFHDIDVRGAHMANLVDLGTALPYNASYQIVRDVDLLSLQLSGVPLWL